jgi:hypothetical protein
MCTDSFQNVRRVNSKSWRIPLILCLLILFGGRSRAGAGEEIVMRSGPQRVSLLELYTSEGCSSCPPAEEWLSALRNDPRLWQAVVPIAFHVNYWDQLGWKDRFAQPSFTQRQRAHAAGDSSIYTPGFLLDGREWRGWFDGRSLATTNDRVGKIEAHVASSGEVAMRFSPEIKFEGGSAHAAWLGFGLLSDVRRGENAGKSLHHDFVVLQHAEAKLSRDGEENWAARLVPPPFSEKAGALAVWIEAGEIPLQAAGGWLKQP